MRGIAARVLFTAMLGLPALGVAGICTVSSLHLLVRNTGVGDALVPVTGFVIPTTVDETAGTISFDLSSFPDTLFQIIVDVELDFPSNGVFAGTIDAAGNIAVPNVELDFLPHIGATPELVVASPTLTTAFGAVTVGDKSYGTEGVALDFATGTLSLQGHTVVPDAPNFGGPVTTGISLDCTLDPKPVAANLPKAPSLKNAGGKGKLGKPVAPADTTVDGDTLTLHSVFTQGAHAVDPASSDLFLRIRNGTGDDVALLWVPAGGLTAKGKKLSVVDSDGSKYRVLSGRKAASAQVSAPLSGLVTLKKTKTGFKLSMKESGLDLSTLAAGTASVDVGIGTTMASDAVAIKVKGSKVTLK